jgi:integrase
MANIEKRISQEGDVSYRVKVRLKGFPAQSATFPRLTDAKRWAQQTEAAIREGRHFKTTEAKRRTLAELVDKYKADVLPHKAEKSVLAQTTQLNWWKAQAGDYALADMTPARIADFRDRLKNEPFLTAGGQEKPRSASTITRYLAALSHVFTVAVKEWGWVDDNPVMKVTKPKQPGGRVRFLDDDERARLLAACRESSNPDLYTAVVLALSTGARQMEVWGLTWKQVDLTRRVIHLEEHQTKNGTRRVLPLEAHALDLMTARAKVRRIGTDLVFPSHNGKQPLDFRQPWESAVKQAGIENFRWHDLRHSTASYLAMNGATLPEIAAVLGHKTLAMVQRYAHLSEAHTSAVVSRMNQKIFGGAA